MQTNQNSKNDFTRPDDAKRSVAQTNTSIGYRSEIDGLRAVALIPVVLFHAGFQPFQGGFIGVDVFFVISGFLITSILIRELEDNSFTLMGFYERRARRILPILLFVTFCCIPLAWLMMLPAEYQDFSRSLVALSVFASNVLFYLEEGDYFSLNAEDKPLLHTWSLAVEEQYYLFFPVFLWLLWRFRKRYVVLVICLVCFLSLFLSELILQKFASFTKANFYLLPTRAWELLAGGLAAFAMSRVQIKHNSIVGTLGLIAIVLSVILFDQQTPFPGKYALVPVAGTVAIILFSDKGGWIYGLLSNRILVGVGLISYSAYLWHQPLFAFARVGSVDSPSSFLMMLLVLLTFVLALLSWKFIETPFRNRRFMSRNSFLFLCGFLLFSTFAVGLLGTMPRVYKQAGAHHVINFNVGNFDFNNAGLQDESWAYMADITSDPDYFVEYNAVDKELWFKPDQNRLNVLLVGNSHAKDMFNVFHNAEVLKEKFQFARYGTQIHQLTDGAGFFDSPNMREADIVVVVSKYNNEDITSMRNVIELLQATGKKVILVKNIFEFEEPRPKKVSLIDAIMHRETEAGEYRAEVLADTINKEYFQHFEQGRMEEYIQQYNVQIEQMGQQIAGLVVLDRMDYVCEKSVASCDAVSRNLDKYFFDYGHHTVTGAKHFAKKVEELNWFKTE